MPSVRIIDVVKGSEEPGDGPPASTSNARRLPFIPGISMNGNFASYVIQASTSILHPPDSKRDMPPFVTVRRRYSDFEVLHAYLQRQHPFVCIPGIPPKQTLLETLSNLAKAPLTLGRLGMASETVARRRLLLGIFLERIVRKADFVQDPVVQSFLGLADASSASWLASTSQIMTRWREMAITAEPSVKIADYGVMSVAAAANKFNDGPVCCVESTLLDLEASLLAFSGILANLESTLGTQLGKLNGITPTHSSNYAN
jgi:hypothetical protein